MLTWINHLPLCPMLLVVRGHHCVLAPPRPPPHHQRPHQLHLPCSRGLAEAAVRCTNNRVYSVSVAYVIAQVSPTTTAIKQGKNEKKEKKERRKRKKRDGYKFLLIT